MQLFQKQRRKPAIILTPLIDILFILIIFFVVSSRIIGDSGIGVVLPKSGQGKDSVSFLPTLMVTSDEQLILNDEPVTWENLAEALQKILEDTPNSPLILNIDERVAHGRVVGLMDQAKEVGFQQIVFGTQYKRANQEPQTDNSTE